MPHSRNLIDFTVAIYLVYKDKVLFVFHNLFNRWLPIGGHIELNENPEQALFKEIKEECGLQVKIYGNKPRFNLDKDIVESLYTPVYMNLSKVNEAHRDVKMVYYARPESDKVKLNTQEHKEYKWFTFDELSDSEYNIREDDQFYAKQGIKMLSKL